MGGECGAAVTDDTAILDNSDHFLGGHVRVVDGFDRRIQLILIVILDDDGGYHCTAGMLLGADGFDGTRNGGVDGSRDRSLCLCDHLTQTDMIADGDQRLAGGTNVHGHGQNDQFGRGELFDGLLVRQRLAVVGMNTALEGLRHNFTSGSDSIGE